MPNPSRPGDLYSEVKIMVPPRLTAKERELFTALAQESDFDPRRDTSGGRSGSRSRDDSGRARRATDRSDRKAAG
jgi:curved DNA-binding protein